MTDRTTGDFLPPDPERHEPEEPHRRTMSEAWSAEDVFGGAILLVIVVTICILVVVWSVKA